MVKKRWLTTFLVIVIALMTMVGCSNSSTTTSTTDAPNTTTNNNAANNKDDKKAPVTFTYFSFDSKKDILSNETVIGKELERQTGVNFKLEHLVGDAKTKSGVMIASGDYPDVIVPNGEIDKILDAGALS